MVATQIEDGVWLGGAADVTTEFLEDNHIQVVISAAEETQMAGTTVQIPVADTPEADIAQHFQAINRLLSAAKHENKNVLLYCCEGTDRAAALLVAHYMIENQWSRKAAVEFVARSRLNVDMRDGFMNQLGSLEASIRLGLYKVD